MLYFNGLPIEKVGYCECSNPPSISTHEEMYGYWDVCCSCGKPLEDGFHFYNHVDGEYQDDIDLY